MNNKNWHLGSNRGELEMRILMYAQHFPPGIGGMEYSNLEIANGLHNLGHEIEVVTVRKTGSGLFNKKLPFKITLLPKWPFLYSYSLAGRSRANWIFGPVYYLKIKAIIKSFSPEVVFVADEASNCFWGSWADKIRVPYMSYCSVPFVSDNGNRGNRGILSELKFAADNIVQNKFKRLILNSYKLAQWISVVSTSTRKEILGLAPWLECRMDIIPRSIDDSFFETQVNKNQVDQLKKKLGIEPTDFVLLTVSKLLPTKGVSDVLKGLALLKNNNQKKIKYVVVCDGSALDDLKQLSWDLGLSKKVIFTGRVQHSALINFYDSCDLFILASKRGKSESFGRVFVEAASRGKVSIGVNQGGMADAVLNGETGFLLQSGVDHEIRDSIAWILENPERKKIMEKKAFEFSKTRFKSLKIAVAIEKRLQSVIDSESMKYSIGGNNCHNE